MSNTTGLRETLAAVALSRRPGVGAKAFKQLIDAHGSPSRALASVEDGAVVGAPRLGRKATFEVTPGDLATAGDDVATTWYGAEDYPKSLAILDEPPPYLFRAGPLWPLPGEAIAIVGPRRCTLEGARVAARVARWAAQHGIAVISGGAMGVDASAHRASLDVGGDTILVAATGLDRVYPAANADLFRQVRRQGCLLTELIPGTPPRRDFFPTRNRIIAGLAAAVIIIEGSNASGTASTAHHAARAGRPILTWCGSPAPALRALPSRLLDHGARRLEPERLDAVGVLVGQRQYRLTRRA